jgi:hypothetical protein
LAPYGDGVIRIFAVARTTAGSIFNSTAAVLDTSSTTHDTVLAIGQRWL